MPADDVGEYFRIYGLGFLEEINIVQRDQSRAHVPMVLARELRVAADIVGRLIILTEETQVRIRLGVAHAVIG